MITASPTKTKTLRLGHHRFEVITLLMPCSLFTLKFFTMYLAALLTLASLIV